MGLALTGLIELVIAILSGSVALLGDALHNLSDVSTSALVFIGFRGSRKVPTERYPYGFLGGPRGVKVNGSRFQTLWS
jgi:divalent metal cation (Fe/Co/Zn/Cd) transporter